MSIIGLGTYKALGEETKTSIWSALDLGYRLFDTADLYKNLEPLGEAIRQAIADKKVTREEVFITTKVWPTYYGEGRVIASIERQLRQTGLEYFDLVLLHWPLVLGDSDTEEFPVDKDGKAIFGTRTLPEIYAELETAHEKGLTRCIGVSNFNAAQIEQIVKNAKIPPVTNQVEAHLYLAQFKLQEFCAKRNIILTAYCPLGASGTKPNTFNLLEDETVKAIGAKYGKTAAQIALRYLVQRGFAIIPKSVHKERQKANMEVFDFEISEEDMKTLKGLDRGQRLITFKHYWTEESQNYPFKDEY